MRTPLNPSANVGGALSTGGDTDLGGGGKPGGTQGTGGSGGLATTSALPGSGGSAGGGGLAGSGGTALTGGMLNSGGTGGAAGTTGSGLVYGKACTTNANCPSGSTCCNGSSEKCDGTLLPTGDGTDPGEFVTSADGTMVTDTITGLVWQAVGTGRRPACTTDPSNLTCTQGEAKTYCSRLTLGGFSDWRLPAEHELHSIVDLAQYNPAIDPTVFPSTTAGVYWPSYWTSSPYTLESVEADAWLIDFTSGESETNSVSTLESVRCVRGSRCYPTSRFVASGGLVTDNLTGLVWQQQSSTTVMTWQAAQSYCPSGFRLPTLKELESLADLTTTSPLAINQTAFPSNPVIAYWTSSPFAGPTGVRWLVTFSGGWASSHEGPGAGVRCVR